MEIKFSHPYKKLKDGKGKVLNRAKLIQVLVLDVSVLTDEFVEYDTDKGLYKLPDHGLVMLLIFLKPFNAAPNDDRHLFCTVRSHNQKKEEYYRANVGQVFKIIYT